jgi:dCMP deaminase
VNREQKILRTIHAEANAILFARQSLDGSTLYVNLPPCSSCAAKIVQTGITRVVFREPPKDFITRWADSFEASLEMFHQVEMQIRIM